MDSVELVEEATQERQAPVVNLLVLVAGDPEGERTFSGSARSLIQALERRGCVRHKANVTAGLTDAFAPGNFWVRTLRRYDRLSLEPRYRWSRMALNSNSRRARRIAAETPEFNACLMYGTNFNPKLDVPTYCYMDATASQVISGGQWATQHFSKRLTQSIYDYQRELFQDCAAVFPRTGWTAASCRDDFGVPEEKLTVVGAGPNYYAEPLPHGPYDRQQILFVGRQWELKNGPLIVEAFRRTRRVLPKARLVIVGCTPEVNEPGVEIVGRISKDAPGGLDSLLRYYSESSVFCIMSCFEAFGISVVEAQNCYVPSVVPARFAFTETVIDGVTGKHVAEYDAEMLAAAFIELLSNPGRLEVMGKAGHDHVRANYSWDIAAARIHERITSDLARRA